MGVLVKICGLTNPADAEAALAAGADLIGIVLVPGTPRAVDPARAAWVASLAGAGTVGVFRDAPLERVLELRTSLRLDWVQLHGSEPDAWTDELGERVLRRVGVGPGGVDWERVRRLSERALPLVDPGAGDGRSADWGAMRAGRPSTVRFGLAGGLRPDTVGCAIRTLAPTLVDVSSGVERRPGSKDRALVEAFVAAVRAAAPDC